MLDVPGWAESAKEPNATKVVAALNATGFGLTLGLHSRIESVADYVAENAHVGVLREGMAIDGYDEPGLYFGTSTGQIFASTDEGESWSQIADYLPAISSVEVAVVD